MIPSFSSLLIYLEPGSGLVTLLYLGLPGRFPGSKYFVGELEDEGLVREMTKGFGDSNQGLFLVASKF